MMRAEIKVVQIGPVLAEEILQLEVDTLKLLNGRFAASDDRLIGNTNR